ncbi:MAG: hypothetical protein KBE23_15640 [Chloroflexi bacterium]|nr:hypothetical protein [Chloroflexota bacterium]MBP7044181.1 hypothetical protein [Chloroflexota bacterium]
MKPSFNWRTEEESDDWAEISPNNPRPPRRGNRPLIFTLSLVLLAVMMIASLVIRRQNAAIARITDDVTAVFAITQQAATSHDAELYAQLISPQDRVWYATQLRLFANGRPLGRASLGLEPVPFAVPTPAITLSPDLRQAELTFAVPYTAVADLGISAPINLKQTAVYRQQNARWLQAPPDETFWGEPATQQIGLVSLSYPARDAAIALRLGQDLAAELNGLCASLRGSGCPSYLRVPLEFSTDPASLANLTDLKTPVWNGRAYRLPAPTLIGLPTDEVSYLAFYRGLTRRIAQTVRAQVYAPVSLPDQTVQTLCYTPDAPGLRLFTYDLAQDTWTAVLPQTAFRSLMPLPNDQGVLVQKLPDSASNRLRLTAVQNTTPTDLINLPDPPSLLRPIGWADTAINDRPHLILQGADADLSTFYRWLDVSACQNATCRPQEVDGYPILSPDGRYTLLVDGSSLYVGNENGRIQQTLGVGFSPFWLDGQTYGFVRFEPQADNMQALVLANQVTGAEPAVLFTSADLLAVVAKTAAAAGAGAAAAAAADIFPKYVVRSPADSGELIIAASGIGDLAGNYYIFTYQLNDGLTLHLELDGAPNGNPAWLTPLGIPPFQLSPDGRWLILSKLRETWTFTLHNLARNESSILTTHYPPYPMRFPYYDWSGDGRWLIIADDGFLRLLAPDYNYERLIPYEFDACLFAAWSE